MNMNSIIKVKVKVIVLLPLLVFASIASASRSANQSYYPQELVSMDELFVIINRIIVAKGR